jgi:hypothetical protein
VPDSRGVRDIQFHKNDAEYNYFANAEPHFGGWSKRILLAAVPAILFLTLYPSRFSLHPHPSLNSSPFHLGRGIKRASTLDFYLNVLLLIPFGFAGPVITNGKVYIGTAAGRDAYDLF